MMVAVNRFSDLNFVARETGLDPSNRDVNNLFITFLLIRSRCYC